VSVALVFSSLHARAGDKSVSIESNPSGAQVEVNGRVTCTTPCSISVPSYYFGKKHTAMSAHGTEPIHLRLSKEGYAPKTVDITTGPIHWASLNGVNSYDYYVIESERFTFQLEASGAGPGVEPETKISAPASATAIVMASPSGASPNQTVENNESPLVIRGVATDPAGILIVTINGATANMRPQNTQATEFWSDPLPLTPGNTPIQIVASNSAHAQTKLVFTLHYAPKAAPANSRALSKEDIVSLLRGGVANARVEEIVKDRGIKFEPTADDLKEIRRAGGNEELIRTLQQAAPSR
jgi:hypothetical protein